jgi:ketol-acid reductoisomerase
MATRYYEKDCDIGVLKGKTCAVIGFGSQGHAHALNAKESGLNVIIGLYDGSKSWKKAEGLGFKVYTAKEAAEKADFIIILINDEKQKALYDASIKSALKPGKTLAFAHGFNIHFKQIVPPADVNVVMIAPKAPGHTVREQYKNGAGVPMLICVHQDATGNAQQIAMAWAAAIGGARAGLLQSTFKQETETDLFGEQAVLCGGVSALMKAGFETLVEAGYEPESAYFETMHEMKLIVDLINRGGLSFMRYSVSDTAEWGDYITEKKIVTPEVRENMRAVLRDIQDGTFATNWLLENQVGRPHFNRMRDMEAQHPAQIVGDQLRAMMPWLKKNEEK